MNGPDLVRIVDSIRREKNIDAEIIFQGIESALASAAKKHFGSAEDVIVTIDRTSGDISASLTGQPIDPGLLGRIAAQTAKQVIIQKIREAERASLMEDYADQIGAIVSGQVTRVEHGNAVVGLGRGEGFLPRSEQIPGETIHVGDRLRALIIEVREAGANVKIVLSRTHANLVARLFELEVPEVAEQVIVIEAIAREPGHRTKVAVASVDSRVDAMGACVGIRGSRIKNIVAEVANEKIDVVRFNKSPQIFIAEALKPAEVKEVLLNREINRATVLVADDQLSLAIGKKGQNVRLASRLTGWNIDILTPAEYEQQRSRAIEQLSSLESVGPDLANDLVAAGYISLADVAEVEPETLARISGVTPEQAREIIAQVGVLVVELDVRAQREAAAKAIADAAEAAAAEAAAQAAPPAEPGAPAAEGGEAPAAAPAAGEASPPAAEGGEAPAAAPAAGEAPPPAAEGGEAPAAAPAAGEAPPPAAEGGEAPAAAPAAGEAPPPAAEGGEAPAAAPAAGEAPPPAAEGGEAPAAASAGEGGQGAPES
jgi:N utilization substance protein A